MENNTRNSALLESLRLMLKPLAKLLIRHGLVFRDMSDVCKLAFYEAGRELLAEQGKKVTDSQLSILTGVHRRDIAALRKDEKKTEIKQHSSGAAIIAEWLTNPLFLDGEGNPRPLPYTGDNASFTQLVECVSKDIRAKSYLEELQRLTLVEVSSGNIVALTQPAFLPNTDWEERLRFFVRNIGDHMAASTANMCSDTPPYFDRSVFHSELTPEQVGVIRDMVNSQGMGLLKRIYRQAETLPKTAASDNRKRVTVGIYMYDEEAGQQ